MCGAGVAAALLAWGIGAGGRLAAQTDEADAPALYTVDCLEDVAQGCTVDQYTYVGWQVFHRTCHVCHAADAVGSDFAPNLLPRIRRMEGREFRSAMETGYAGEADMPPWGEDPDVRPYYFELWAYLSARANGDLPPGEPRRVPGASD